MLSVSFLGYTWAKLGFTQKSLSVHIVLLQLGIPDMSPYDRVVEILLNTVEHSGRPTSETGTWVQKQTNLFNLELQLCMSIQENHSL